MIFEYAIILDLLLFLTAIVIILWMYITFHEVFCTSQSIPVCTTHLTVCLLTVYNVGFFFFQSTSHSRDVYTRDQRNIHILYLSNLYIWQNRQ